MKKIRIPFLLTLISILALAVPALAAEPVVHAVLFFSPTCGHCHEVIENVLPPIQEKYGEKLDILFIDATTAEGGKLYMAYLDKYQGNRGVPAMIVGDVIMVGSTEIPERLEGLIDAGLAAGGVDFPDLNGLEEYRVALEGAESPTDPETVALQSTPPAESTSIPLTPAQSQPQFIQMFQRDITGNSIAVITLLVMVLSVIWVLIVFLKPQDEANPPRLPRFYWLIPLLCLAGLGVAGYMTYVEVTHVQAVCGPIGDCNSVQQSPYAVLFGFLPVGIFGLIGYIAILAAWAVWRFMKNAALRKLAAFAMWGMAVFGVLFSIYLTYLEPFVIGATCMWCITSAVIILVLLWLTTPLASYAMWDGESISDLSPTSPQSGRRTPANPPQKTSLTHQAVNHHKRSPKKNRH